ncbi:hypothetical protein LDJ78_25040 [Citrobacter portucalensis]|nr:hypothetical protein [Citrobacter portucalensis]
MSHKFGLTIDQVEKQRLKFGYNELEKSNFQFSLRRSSLFH